MSAYLKVCEYFVFFTACLKYTGSKSPYKHIESYLIVKYTPHNKIYPWVLQNITVIVEYDKIVVAKIYSWIMCSYFIVVFTYCE